MSSFRLHDLHAGMVLGFHWAIAVMVIVVAVAVMMAVQRLLLLRLLWVVMRRMRVVLAQQIEAVIVAIR